MTQPAPPPQWLQATMGDAPASAMVPPTLPTGGALPAPTQAAPAAPAAAEEEASGGTPLTQAFRAGALKLKTGEKVPVRLADGSIGTVDAKDAQGVVDSGGDLIEHAELRRAQIEARYGGAAGGLGAFGAGAARGLSVGLSDPVALGLANAIGGKEAKESLRERLNAYQELHPIASTAGEVTGVLAPALVSGGAAALAEGGVRGAGAIAQGARVAGALNEGIGIAGRAGEAVARRVVGEGASSLGARVAQTAIAKAAGAAIEGGIYGAGAEISESALGDTRLTGEKLLASIGHGAILGAAVGGALGAGKEIGAAALAKGQPFLRAKAEEQAWKSLNPLKKFTNEAEARAGGTRAVGRTLLDEGVFEGAATSEDLLPKIAAAKEKVGQELGAALESSGAKLPGEAIAKRVDDVIEKYRGKAGFEPMVKSLEKYELSLANQLGGLQEGTSIPVQNLFEQRKALDQLVYQETKSLDPKLRVAALREIRGELAEMEVQAIDRASKEVGEGISGKELKDLRKRYQHLSIAESAAEDATSRMQTNRNFSLSDYATAGSMLAAGHPVGALGALGVHKALRERGNAMLATYLDKLGALGSIESRAAAVDKQIDQGLNGFFARVTKGEEAAQPKLRARTVSRFDGESPRDEYEQRARELGAVKTNREKLTEHVATSASRLAPHAPETVQHLTEATKQAATFLASKLPTQRQSPGVVSLALRMPRPSDQEVDRFLRYARAVDDPTSVVSDLQKGKISREGVEAIRAVYPSLYQQVRAKVMERVSKLAASETPVPYAERVSLGMLLDLPTDWSITPAGVKALQDIVQSPPAKKPGEPGGGPQGPSRPVQTPTAREMQTPFERRAGGQLR